MTDMTLQVHAESAGKQDGLGIFVTRVSFPFENRPKQATPQGFRDSCESDSRGLSVSQ